MNDFKETEIPEDDHQYIKTCIIPKTQIMKRLVNNDCTIQRKYSAKAQSHEKQKEH